MIDDTVSSAIVDAGAVAAFNFSASSSLTSPPYSAIALLGSDANFTRKSLSLFSRFWSSSGLKSDIFCPSDLPCCVRMTSGKKRVKFSLLQPLAGLERAPNENLQTEGFPDSEVDGLKRLGYVC